MDLIYSNVVLENGISSNTNEIDNIEENINIAFSNDVKKVIKDIDVIPLALIKNTTKIEYNTECPICYDQFVVMDLVRILPCKHQMHRLCIDNYLQKEACLCPLCKNPAGETKFINI